MRIGVTEIVEKDFYIYIDTSSMSDAEQDELYDEISCCCEDIDALTYILDEMQVNYEKYEEGTNSRIEMGRY
jgi:hypothetical protein